MNAADDEHLASCDEALREVYFYLDAECDSGAKARIKGHLAQCVDCMQEYGIEQEVKALVARVCGSEAAPEGLILRLREKLSEVVPVDATGVDSLGPPAPGMGMGDNHVR